MTILLTCLLSFFVTVPQATRPHPVGQALLPVPIEQATLACSSDFGRIPAAPRLAQDSGASFTIENETTANLGSVTITMTDYSYITIGVSGMGVFYGSITRQPSQSTMLAQTFAYDTQKWIMIDAHTAVRATWNGNVIVIDNQENF